MPKRRGITVLFLVLLAVVMSVCLFACENENDSEITVTKLTVVSVAQSEFVLGDEVVLSGVKLRAEFSDKTNREFVLEDEMLSEADRNKFFTPGVHAVTVQYEGVSAVFQITVIEKKTEVLYRAVFYSNGGTAVADQNVKTIISLVNPIRLDYTFDGWYTNPEFTGNRAITPFTLTKNTIFYAKWVDNRRCKVTFVDEDGTPIHTVDDVVYGTGINIEDLTAYPPPDDKLGKRFVGWTYEFGSNPENITTDTVFKATYESVRCTVIIKHWDGTKETEAVTTLDYNEIFDVSHYVMPTKEGHTSRWVIYRNDADVYEEWPSGETSFKVTDDKLLIQAVHIIDTYAVSIHNGAADQPDENLKSGNIELERVVIDESLSDFKVDYNTNFLISSYTQTPYLKEPTVYDGYTGVWCYVVVTNTGEIWRNAKNEVWDEREGKFILIQGEDATTNFDLRDKDGKYLARVENGDLKNVRGNVTIKAKYIKKTFTVSLLRLKSDSAWETIGTFKEVYRADFKLYDPEKYPNMGTAEDVEKNYLLHRVASWNTDVFDDWSSIYANGGREQDWAIEWYTSPTYNETNRQDFREANGQLGSYEIKNNVTFYCKDIDQRTYDATFYFGYDFTNKDYPNDPMHRVTYHGLSEHEKIIAPEGSDGTVTEQIPYNGADYTLTYRFKGWYDYPYRKGEPLGELQTLETRTKHQMLYAHYECTTTWSLTVYDKTQRFAFNGTGFENRGFDVPEETIYYEGNAGLIFDTSMLFKGRQNADNSIISGQTYYNRYSTVQTINNTGSESNPTATYIYQSLLLKYGGAGKDKKTEALSTLDALITALGAKLARYNTLLKALHDYDSIDNSEITLEYFNANFINLADYHTYRKELYLLEQERETINGYDTMVIKAHEYEQEDNSDTTGGFRFYKKYTESLYHLNAAYGYTKDDVDNGNYKYRFAGWYNDSKYTDLFSAEFDFSMFFVGGSVKLYAKWADEEKGSEGLVFKKFMYNNNPVVAVVDFVTKAQYDDPSNPFYQCGFNEVNSDYSINFNDQDEVPLDLGKSIDVQIPAYHGGTAASGYPVLGILASAFKRFGGDIFAISLPDGIQFLEEKAFENCSLTRIYGGENNSIAVLDNRAVYQKLSFSADAISVVGNNLVAYAKASSETTFSLPVTAERIGEGAFYGASKLQYVNMGDSLVSIGDGAFEGSGLRGLCKTDVITGSVTTEEIVRLPVSLTKVGSRAFKNCAHIVTIEIDPLVQLKDVGRDAFSGTRYYDAQSGVITMGSAVIGWRNGDENTFKKDVNGQYVEEIGHDNRAKYIVENKGNKLYYDKETLRLTEMSISDAIIHIAAGAIHELKDADYIFINAKELKFIGKQAFSSCINLREIYLNNLPVSAVAEQDAFVGYTKGLKLFVPDANTVHESFRQYIGIEVVNVP